MLRARLFLGLLPLVLLLAGTGGYAIHVSRQLAGSLQRDLVGNYRDILACQQMRSSVRLMTSAVSLARRGDPLDARREFDEQRAAFTKELMAQSASSAGTPRARPVEQLDAAFTELTRQGEALLAAGGTGSLELIRQHEAAIYRVLAAIEELNRRDFASAQLTAVRAGELVATTERVLLTAIVAAVLLAALVAWRLAAALLRPIQALTASAVAVGEGDLERTVPVLSRDELGQLAQAFNQMSTKLRAYRDAMQERVLRTQRTMEATLTSAPDPLFLVGADGCVTVRNPAAEELARTAEFRDGFPAPLAAPLQQVLGSGEHYLPTDYARVVTVRVGREDRHYLPRILAVGDRLTGFRGAAVVLQDVTKFRLLDDAKTNLVGTVSHELKTPLTSLRMAVYLLLEQNVGALTASQRELLEGARDDADRLLRILDGLLDLARLEAGASALDRRDVRVGDLLADIAAEAHGFIASANLRLETRCAPEVADLVVHVDVERLRHVFINLLTNAVKFSPSGGTITLTADAPPDVVQFGVRDDGPGMEPETAARVFDRFYRAPGQTKPGAGLGLAIAREIVVAHGGSISCVSAPARGAEFTFMLPR
jgi:signal transduction histidine kinase